MSTTTDTITEAPVLVRLMKEDDRLRPLRTACDSLRRANSELREQIEKMREEADALIKQATTGSCYPQTTIGSSLFHDPTEHAHRAAAAAASQRGATEMIYLLVDQMVVIPGADMDELTEELVSYICENAGDWKFRL